LEDSNVGKHNQIEIKQHLTRDELISHLHALADSFAAGNVVIQQGPRVAALQPSEHAELEIEAEEKKGKSKLTFSISWNTALGLSLEEALKISADLPPEPPPVEAPAQAE
jgi:amphi-Trp domain-containing protein